MIEETKSDYGLGERPELKRIDAPLLDYLPGNPSHYSPCIGLIGCGGVTVHHLSAYKKAGYKVTAVCDIDKTRAEEAQKVFFPEADVFTDYMELLGREDVEVVDIALHPEVRLPIIQAAIERGKHVLSQKPFVKDLNEGQRIIEKADRKGVKLAVNQNGRWAPHFSYIRHAVREGIIGEVTAAHFSVSWNHTWIKGTHFENIKYLLLYDFGIHWFDMLSVIMRGKKAESVYASTGRSPGQEVKPPFLSQAVVSFKEAQGSINLQANTYYGQTDRTIVLGTKGMIQSEGPDLNTQSIVLNTVNGTAKFDPAGTWFTNGFHGTMAELLCAIEERRQPDNSGEDNLNSLALCFAAVKSAETGKPVIPSSVTSFIH